MTRVSWDISNKSELNTAKMAQLTQFQQLFMVSGHYMYTKYEQALTKAYSLHDLRSGDF